MCWIGRIIDLYLHWRQIVACGGVVAKLAHPLRPQAQTVPSDFSAMPKLIPAAMATTLVRPLTVTGDVELVVVLLPSWP